MTKNRRVYSHIFVLRFVRTGIEVELEHLVKNWNKRGVNNISSVFLLSYFLWSTCLNSFIPLWQKMDDTLNVMTFHFHHTAKKRIKNIIILAWKYLMVFSITIRPLIWNFWSGKYNKFDINITSSENY